MSSPFWIVAFAALMFGMGWVAVRWISRRGTAEYRTQAEKLERISSLSVHEAASRALPVLSNNTIFRTIESPVADGDSLEGLAPELRKVLERYEAIEVLAASQASVTRSSIGPSPRKPGFVKIGSVSGGTDFEGEISVRPGDEVFYELYADEAPDPGFGTYRSIYHWVLAMAEEQSQTSARR